MTSEANEDVVNSIFNYWIDCVCQFFFSILGVVMNLIIILIISSKKDLHNIFNWMVLTLSCCDTSVLLSMLLISLSTTPFIKFDQSFLIMLLPYFTYPAVHIASTASAIMTVALAHERYLAVQAPIVYSQMLRRASAQRRRLTMHVLPVLLFAILFNMPTFWCVENCCDNACYASPIKNNTLPDDPNGIKSIAPDVSATTMKSPNYISNQPVISLPNSTTFIAKNYVPNSIRQNSNGIVDQTSLNPNPNQNILSNNENEALMSSYEQTYEDIYTTISDEKNKSLQPLDEIDKPCPKIGFRYTAFRSHPYFIMFYQNLARLIVLGLLPFALLIFFNCSIYLAIKRRRVRHRHQEENMAIVLMGIVSLFLVCNSFRIFLNFYEAVYEIKSLGSDESRDPIKLKPWFRYAGIISNLFVTLNACCNLIIYCALNNQFRNHFFEVITFCKLPFVRSRNETIQLQNAQPVETQAMLTTTNPTHSPSTNITELRGENGVRTVIVDGELPEQNHSENNTGNKKDNV